MAGGMPMPHIPKAPLSDETMRVISSLQVQLKRVHRKVRAVEEATERALDDAEENGVHMDVWCDRHQEVERRLQSLREECDEDSKHEERLTEHLTELQEQMLETRSRMEHQISQEEIEALKGELQEMRTRLVEAEKENQELRVRLAQVEEARRKRTRRLSAPESEPIRQAVGHERACRMSEAKQLSARAVSGQKERDAKIQVERVVQLTRQKERLEAEWHECCADNVRREEVLEEIRSRNKKLEAVQKRFREASEEQEAILHKETRKHSRQIQVLRSLLGSDGVLDYNGISGGHRGINVLIDDGSSATSDDCENVRMQLADRMEAVLTDRGCGTGNAGSPNGSVSRAAVAHDQARACASPDVLCWEQNEAQRQHFGLSGPASSMGGEDFGEASIRLWDGSALSAPSRNGEEHYTGNLIVEQDAANREQRYLDSQEEIECCLGRWQAATSRTKQLVGEVREWCHELGDSPVDSIQHLQTHHA